MPMIRYLDKVFKKPTLETIAKANEIATEYQRQGYELRLFVGQEVEVKRVALNLDQIRQYSPPPNPAKVTDARAAKYPRCWTS